MVGPAGAVSGGADAGRQRAGSGGTGHGTAGGTGHGTAAGAGHGTAGDVERRGAGWAGPGRMRQAAEARRQAAGRHDESTGWPGVPPLAAESSATSARQAGGGPGGQRGVAAEAVPPWPALPDELASAPAAGVPRWESAADRVRPWPALPDDAALWSVPAGALDREHLSRLDREQAGG
ncbi:hypothetical protein C1I99_31075 [Micromonospora deserti]|uniref:Uncharacterized protein n=1 Tax=Micromonospora deserti TaxID=2070366 RepID=A0A2W2CT93_9ACTN|nr:hypothetical protein C1I99_31075 [Micromonospora deserti]